MKIYSISLKGKEKRELRSLLKKGNQSARTINRARILLLSSKRKADKEIIELLEVSEHTPRNVRKRYLDGGLNQALYDAPRSGQPKITTNDEETTITAIACTQPDDGYGKWSLDLLTKKVNGELKKKKGRKKPIGRTTVYNVLLRSDLKPWREKNVVYRGND